MPAGGGVPKIVASINLPISACSSAVLGCGFCSLVVEFVEAPTFHLRVEHFQGSAAGVDLVVMREIGEAFEDLLSTAERPGVMATGAAKPTDQRGGDRPTNAEPSQNRAPG